MKITSVKINKVSNHKNLLAHVSVVIDDGIAIHGIGIFKSNDGSTKYVGFPGRWNDRKKQFYNVVHPINNDTRKAICDAVLAEYEGSAA